MADIFCEKTLVLAMQHFGQALVGESEPIFQKSHV